MTSQSPAIPSTIPAQPAPSAPSSSGRMWPQRSRLPITRDLSLAYVLSLVIAFLMSVASLTGLLAGGRIYPTSQLSGNTGTDALTLIVGLPLLLGSMWLARRGSLVGLLCWPGALFYVLYVYAFYLLSVPFNALFLPYALLVTLSAYTTIGLVASIESETVRQQVSSRVPARTIAVSLIAIALLFTTVDTVLIGAVLASSAAVDATTHVSWIVDFVIELPALLIAGVLLWRQKALGYVAAPGLLLQGGVLNAGYAIVLALQAVFGAAPITGPFVAIVFVIGALSFILFALFLRGAIRSQKPAALNGEEGVAGDV